MPGKMNLMTHKSQDPEHTKLTLRWCTVVAFTLAEVVRLNIATPDYFGSIYFEYIISSFLIFWMFMAEIAEVIISYKRSRHSFSLAL